MDPHPFDAALALTRQADGRHAGTVPPPYWNMVGPFGGTTAAVLMRAALADQPEGIEPVAFTVNYCAALARGGFTIDVRTVSAGKSVRHVNVEMQQGDAIVTTASAVLALRRRTWAHQPARPPAVPPPEMVPAMDTEGSPQWLQRYEFRFVSGAWQWRALPYDTPHGARSTLWVADKPRRALDFLSLTALADVFFVRAFHVRGNTVPAGTVSMTVHYHASAEGLAAHGDAPVLCTVDAHTFARNFGDQLAQLWSGDGRLLATTTQMTWFKE
ncbi:MAG TPA: thioesterase family protein [Burkholderiaceae bacterium]|nr:thioesterase family protein [Burkholderiaceae bacterium]